MELESQKYSESEELKHLQTSYANILSMKGGDGNPDLERQTLELIMDFKWMANKIQGGLQTRIFHRLADNICHIVLEVKKSELKDAGLGLFTCTNFKKGEIVTIYVGKLIGPSINSKYSVTNGSILLGCMAWRKGPSYLGAYMCNDPLWQSGGLKSKVKPNAKIVHDFRIVATRAINVGDEIILKYNLV